MVTIENPPNSVWPNGLKIDSEGYVTFYPLGTNKVNVSTSSLEWPKGDKLISPFVYQDDKLVGFVDTKAFTTDSQTTIYLPYEHIEAEFSAIDKGQLQIHAPKATTKTAKWSDGSKETIDEVTFKYKGCATLDDIKVVDANYLTTDIVVGAWFEPLWDLTAGDAMFHSCISLTHFTSDLPNLIQARLMFKGCSNLESFSSDLSRLAQGGTMFSGCSNLTSFTSNLSYLQIAVNMFNGCKLDAQSVKNIIDTINTYSGSLDLGIGCDNTTEDKDLFAQEVGYADMNALLDDLQDKGWTVEVQYNGRPITTHSLRKTSTDTLPVFVKLEETEKYADYTSEDGSKKYMLNYFHETTGSTEGYTQYATLEEAIESLNIKPIEK